MLTIDYDDWKLATPPEPRVWEDAPLAPLMAIDEDEESDMDECSYCGHTRQWHEDGESDCTVEECYCPEFDYYDCDYDEMWFP